MERKIDEPEDQPSVKRRRVNSSSSDNNGIISISSNENGINNSSSSDDSSNISVSDDDNSIIPSSDDDNNHISSSDDDNNHISSSDDDNNHISSSDDDNNHISSSDDDNGRISSSDDDDSSSVSSSDDNEKIAGKIKRIFIKNFMCFDVMEVIFNPRINFIIGEKSSISAILTALTIGLGARASVTGRGPSIKEFIKKGEDRVLIEITITNGGSSAYKYETYGNSITIVRSIVGNNYSYAIKDSTGTVISRKKSELDNIVKGLNIKIDNPILITRARLFCSPRSEQMFRLFKKSIKLEVGDFCSTTKELCLVAAQKLLSEYENEIENLEKEIKIAESLNKMNEDYRNLENELLWSKVIQEEKQLLQIDAKRKEKEKCIDIYQNNINDNAAQEKEIGAKIKNLKEEVKAKISDCYSKVSELKNKYFALLQVAIKKVQVNNSTGSRKQEAMKKKAMCEQDLDNLQANLSAKQTELKQLEENNRKIENTEGHEYQLKIDFHKKNIELCNLRQQLATFEKESNDIEALYGLSMHQLLGRIKEAHNKRKFKEKPIGPLGSFIRSKDSSWIPAIENHLGVDTLTSFCVDNAQDSSVLDTIMKEVYRDNRRPKIRISKFKNLPHVHDVRRRSTHSSIYLNLLDVLEISDPVIANSLIDEREIECTLLIPTSEEARLVMSDIRKIPKNCKRAITKQADLFYPTPVYHVYEGSTTKPKFLQMSTKEAIKALQKEIEMKKEELQQLDKKMKNIDENTKKNKEKMQIVQQIISRLNQNKNQLKISIDEAKKIIDSCNNVALDTVLTELEEFQSLIAKTKEIECYLMEKLHKLQKRLKSKSTEDKIGKLCDEKNVLSCVRHEVKQQIADEKQMLQKLSAMHQHQQSVVNSKIENANKACSRINTRRTSEEINAKLKELKVTISVAEYISKDAVKEELNEKKTSCNVVKDLIAVFTSSNQDSEESKIKSYLEAREQLIIHRIQQTFTNLLSLRNYKGKITIDHNAYLFNLEVISKKDAKCLTNDNETISDEKNYHSTVALILALWGVVELPFYFLDTTSFMDEKNGRIIMDQLLKHAESNPQKQFVFLTPVDIPHSQEDNSITIHRLPTSPKKTA